jgi:hypothetical protein
MGLKVVPLKARNKPQQQWRSPAVNSPVDPPVELAIRIREGLKEFRRTSSPQAYREELREALRERFRQGISAPEPGPEDGLEASPVYFDSYPAFECHSLLDYLEHRGLIRLRSNRR